MQLQSDEESWKDMFVQLACQSTAIFLVLDERAGTICEFETILGSNELRRKLIVMMAPEQYGWWRYVRHLPTVRQSWVASGCSAMPGLHCRPICRRDS